MKILFHPVFHSKTISFNRIMRNLWIAFLISILLGACAKLTSEPDVPPTSKELVLYNWVNYMPQSVLDAFEQKYGVKVTYLTYNSMDEGIENIKTGRVHYDVAVIENDNIADLITEKKLAQINYDNVSNLKNISANFRDLIFDPGNRYSVPYTYGTTGLLVRTDLIKTPVTRWADLWEPQYAGKIAVRIQSKEWMGFALKSLGYSINSEDPAELQAAKDRLLVFKKSARFVDSDPDVALQPLLNGEVVILVGWNGDARVARQKNPDIQYVLPEEGTMIWGDSLVISSESQNQSTAELFLNFLLQPDISSEIVKTYFYPTANDSAFNMLPAEIANDTLIYPPHQLLSKNDFFLPLSPEGMQLRDEIWKQVMESE